MKDLRKLKLGETLMQAGKLDEEQLSQALSLQKKVGKKLSDVLVSEGFITEEDMIEVLEFQLGFPHIDLDTYPVNQAFSKLVPENIARRYNLMAIDEKENLVLVAMEDPLNIFAIDDVRMAIKRDIQPVISSKQKLRNAIDRFYGGADIRKIVEEFEDSYKPLKVDLAEDQENLDVASAPIVKLLQTIIENAILQKASDIHIEPEEKNVRIRYRIDGDLVEVMDLGKNILTGLTTRVKIIGRMNIAEKRIPQDGRVEMKISGKDIDMRISTLPTIHGEKTVIRLLDREGFNFSKESIGFTERDLKRFEEVISQPYGMILVTGPTGSGKSTTLYSILKEFNTEDRNVITLEDPVEYKLKGINQVQVNEKAGMTFATGLRSILRQDPDVVMVGEIRDGETAEISIRASITGHIVLSTLHTNDSPSTIARLVDMGIEPYLVSSAVVGILSQRLVKKLCPRCKEEYQANKTEKRRLGVEEGQDLTLYKAKGCSYCNNGYTGRTAVHELMVMTESIRALVDRGANTDEIRKKALEEGMNTLLDAGSRLAVAGTTSYEEVMRIGYTI